MEKDFEGFINYVYELKKNKDIGVSNEITDIDLYQWKKSLQEKEQERLKLLEDALNGIDDKTKYMNNPSILRNKDDPIYKTAIPPPNILSDLGVEGYQHPATQDYPNKYSDMNKGSSSNNFKQYEEDQMDDVLKQYDQFKEQTEKMQEDRKQFENQHDLNNVNPQPIPPNQQDMPYLRDPQIRDLYDEYSKGPKLLSDHPNQSQPQASLHPSQNPQASLHPSQNPQPSLHPSQQPQAQIQPQPQQNPIPQDQPLPIFEPSLNIHNPSDPYDPRTAEEYKANPLSNNNQNIQNPNSALQPVIPQSADVPLPESK